MNGGSNVDGISKTNSSYEIRKLLKSKDYDFLRENVHLNDNIILLGLGGSYAYGTNTEGSDIDIRGIATNTVKNILISSDFEQVVDDSTDTTVYSFDKIVKLLCSCNPNVIELLGLKKEHYLYLSPVGQELLDNKTMFLSKKAIHSFGGYANAQLRRLENKAARLTNQTQNEINILKSIQFAYEDLKNRYAEIPESALKLYVDKSCREGFDSEIFLDISLKNYPLRDCKDWLRDMEAIVKSYNKIGRRNEKAIRKDKLSKHMMHLVRLYLMCFDILEKEEIITYRETEHDFLMSIRNGDYLDANQQPTADFYDIVSFYEKKLDYLKDHTNLPEQVDYDKINDFVASVNERIILNRR